MQRPWVTWSPRRFGSTVLPAFAALIAVRIVVLRKIESQAAEIAIQCVFILMSMVGLYITFTWAAEHDRRNPRDYTK